MKRLFWNIISLVVIIVVLCIIAYKINILPQFLVAPVEAVLGFLKSICEVIANFFIRIFAWIGDKLS